MHVCQRGSVVGKKNFKLKVFTDRFKNKKGNEKNMSMSLKKYPSFCVSCAIFSWGKNSLSSFLTTVWYRSFSSASQLLICTFLFMRLFPKGDIVSIHTVYCGIFWTFLCVDKKEKKKKKIVSSVAQIVRWQGEGRVGRVGNGQIFCVLWSLHWMEKMWMSKCPV